MEIYILITILLIICSPLKPKSNVTKWLFIAFVIFFIFMSGLRGVGYDYYNYSIIIYEKNEGALMEPSFELLLWITRFFNNSIALFFPVAIAAVTLKTSFIYKYSYFPFLSLLIYFHISFLIHDMGQMRYGLAMGLVLYAIINLARGKAKVFFVLTTIAASFHFSALAVYPIWYLRNLRITDSQFILFVLLMFVFVSIDVTGIFLKVIEVLPFQSMVSKIIAYTVLNDEEYNNAVGLNASFAIRFISLVLLYIFRDKCHDINYNSIFNFYFYGIIIYLLLGGIPAFSYRCSFYFRLLDIIIIPFVIYHLKISALKFILFVLIILYCSWKTFNATTDSEFWKDYAPYKTALE